jgi:hypothetical protein
LRSPCHGSLPEACAPAPASDEREDVPQPDQEDEDDRGGGEPDGRRLRRLREDDIDAAGKTRW